MWRKRFCRRTCWCYALQCIGLIKIYTRFDKITTLADNFLAFIALGYLIATIVSYLALRIEQQPPDGPVWPDVGSGVSDFVGLHGRLALLLRLQLAG